MNEREKIKAIEALYATLPKLECKGLCEECCGPVYMSRAEWDRIKIKVGHTPAPVDGGSLVCPMLKNHRCTVYKVRPLICRLWGMMEAMKCPHGCTPERWVTDEEASRLVREIAEIGA